MSVAEQVSRISGARDTLRATLIRLGIISEDDQSQINSLATAADTGLQISVPATSGGVITIPKGYVTEELTFNIGEEMYITLSFVKPANKNPLTLAVMVATDPNMSEIVGVYSLYNNIEMFEIFDGTNWMTVPSGELGEVFDNKTVNLDLGTTLAGSSKYYVKYTWTDTVTNVVVESHSYVYPSGVGVSELYEREAEVDETLDEVSDLLDDLNVEII